MDLGLSLDIALNGIGPEGNGPQIFLSLDSYTQPSLTWGLLLV
jgi:hypothetical protein